MFAWFSFNNSTGYSDQVMLDVSSHQDSVTVQGSDARLPVAFEVDMPITVRVGRCDTSLWYGELACVVRVQSVTWAAVVGCPCDWWWLCCCHPAVLWILP